MLLFALTACNQKTVDFTYSPAQPRAGEEVSFTNQSSFGENWTWLFGDNMTSSLKHPSHVFKKPGRYTVQMMVDSVTHYTCTHTIEVFDTVPSFRCETDSVYLFETVGLEAQIFNPFDHAITYAWTLPDEAMLISGVLDESRVVVRFTRPNIDAPVRLVMNFDGQMIDTTRLIHVYDRPAPSLLMRHSDLSISEHRLYDDLWETARNAYSERHWDMLVQAPDSVVTDVMAQKQYYCDDSGLWVAGINGANPVLIDAATITALCIDDNYHRIYWATTAGTYRMPLVMSLNNRFVPSFDTLNLFTDIDKLTIDHEPH